MFLLLYLSILCFYINIIKRAPFYTKLSDNTFAYDLVVCFYTDLKKHIEGKTLYMFAWLHQNFKSYM